MKESHHLQLFVENRVGVLDQISILVRRSGWNVTSIHSCEEPWNEGTRVILSIEGHAELRLLLEQFHRLDCMKELKICDGIMQRHEVVLLKGSVQSVADIYGATPVGENVFRFTGTVQEVVKFIEECRAQGSVELMCSGAIFLS